MEVMQEGMLGVGVTEGDATELNYLLWRSEKGAAKRRIFLLTE